MGFGKYWTPMRAAKIGLEYGRQVDLWSKDSTFADPCAGVARLESAALELDYDNTWKLSDVSPDLNRVANIDVFDWEPGDDVDAVVTNPPYAADSGSVGEILAHIRDVFDGPIAAFTRIGFLEACSDREWAWYEDPPFGVVEVGRVSYDRPGGESAGSSPRFSSVWMYWKSKDDPSPYPTFYKSISETGKETLLGG